MVLVGKTVVLTLFFLYFQCWIKNRNIRATKSFCPGMRHSFFPSFPTSQLPPSPVAVGSKIWTHGLFNVSPTFPSLLTSCCLHLQCRIEYIGLRSKKSGFSPHTLEVPLTTFIRNVQATWYAGRKNEKGAILGEKKGNLDLRITYPTKNQEILPYDLAAFMFLSTTENKTKWCKEGRRERKFGMQPPRLPPHAQTRWHNKHNIFSFDSWYMKFLFH